MLDDIKTIEQVAHPSYKDLKTFDNIAAPLIKGLVKKIIGRGAPPPRRRRQRRNYRIIYH